jgi:hypothetical protein
MSADPVKISGESTLLFPLLVSQTFAKCTKEFDDFNEKAALREGTEWWRKQADHH